MKRLLFILAFAAALVACNRHSEHWATITEMETIIEERPDSVLNVLQAIDTDELIGNEERAKHALLLSMALDKNYIDRTDFEVLQPAIDYYDDNGSATDKLRTYYYQGRIHQNAGNDDLAMECFVNAITNGKESNDILTKARLYVAQGNIYYTLMKWEKVYEVNLKAADYFFQADKINSFINCTLKAVSAFSQKEDYQQSAKYLTECEKYLNIIPKALLANYYSEYLTYLIRIEATDNIQDIVGIYLSEIPDDLLDYGTLSNAYIALGEYGKALETINKIDNFPSAVSEIRYYAILSEIHHKLDNYKAALEAYIIYNQLNDAANMKIFEQETQFVEERHNLEMAKARETEAKNRLTIIVLGCAVALMASLYIINLIRKRLKKSRVENAQLLSEKALYEQMYNEVVAERDALNEMIANNTIKEEAMEIIKRRLGVLNTIIVSHLSAKDTDIKRANEELERLIDNRNDFIKSTRLTLEENYPHFFAYLHDKGLEEFEIDFCCLYAIGLKGKEIKAYTNLSRHYKDSSEVRQNSDSRRATQTSPISCRNCLKRRVSKLFILRH